MSGSAVFPLDFMAADPPPGVVATGLGNLEVGEGLGERWLSGPETTMRFRAAQTGTLHLVFRYASPLEGQTVRVLVNGVQAGEFSPGSDTRRKVAFTTRSGENELTLCFAVWNHGQASFAPADPRKLAGLFRELSLEQ